MDKIYESKGLEYVLLMQEADVGFHYFLSSNGPLTVDFLLDKSLIKFRRASNELKISLLPNKGAMNPYMKSNLTYLTFKINSCTHSSSSL
jgi:hypothetical protein